jgi:hypothetical protein
MHLARRLLPVPLVLLALAGCARSKPKESPAPAADPSASASAAIASAPVRTPAALLCSDGLHRRGDHWKVDCNPCRCAADGDIVCAHFPCAAPAAPAGDAGPRDASAP